MPKKALILALFLLPLSIPASASALAVAEPPAAPSAQPRQGCDVASIERAFMAAPLWCRTGAGDQAQRDEILAAFSRIACCSTEEIRAAVAAIDVELKRQDDAVAAIVLERLNARREGRPEPPGEAVANLANADFVERSMNLYLLADALFALPEGLSQRDLPWFTAWQHTYEPYESRSALWPFEADGAGRLRLTGFLLFYTGGRSSGLAAFDYFAARYPRRADLCGAR